MNVEATVPALDDEFDHVDWLAARLGADPMPARRETLDPAGALSAIAWGGDEPEFVLLHGAALNAHSWDSTALLLGRPSVAIDMPGHGDSPWRSDVDYRPTTMAAVLRDAPVWGRGPVLVGHSWGGLTALALLPRIAVRPRALVLVDITPSAIAGDRPRAPGVFGDGLRFGSREEAVDWAAARGLGADRDSLRLGIRFNTRVNADGSVEFKHHFGRLAPGEGTTVDDPEQLWSGLDPAVPFVVVRGTRGYLTPEHVAELRERAPWVTIHDVEAGHNVHQGAAHEMAGILRGL